MTCIHCSFKSAKEPQAKVRAIGSKKSWLSGPAGSRTNIQPMDKFYDSENLDLVLEILWYLGINFRFTRLKSWFGNAVRNIVRVLYFLGVIYSFGIRLYAFAIYNSGTNIITELLAFLCSICVWITVNLKRHKIVAIRDFIYANRSEARKWSGSARKKSWFVQCLCFITVTLPAFSAASSMLISKYHSENINSYLTFLSLGFNPDVGLYHKYILLFLLRSCDLSICFVSSQISCLLLSLLCYNVSCYVNESKPQLIKVAQNVNFSAGSFIQRYKKVKKVVSDLEKAISLPMFFAMAFLVCELFALMSNSVSIVRNKSSLASLVIVLCAFSTTSFYVVFVIFKASNVEEVHKSLISAFVDLPDESTQQLLCAIKLMAFQDSLQITAWRMFPMKRGFFLTIAGTLATYGVLLVQFT